MEFLVALIALAVWMIIAIVAIGVVMAVFVGIIAIFTTPTGNQVGAVLLMIGAIVLMVLVL